MSGCNPTYSVHSISILAVLVTQKAILYEIHPMEVIQELMNEKQQHNGKISAMISGDHCTLFDDRNMINIVCQDFHVTNEMGKIRKDKGLMACTPIKHKTEDVEFCSHRY